MKKFALLLTIALLVAFSSCATAETGEAPGSAPGAQTSAAADFPQKTIRILVPYGAGGNTDLNARIIADIATQNGYIPNGHAMIVTDLPGANTMNAIQALLDADPDGYTIMLHQTSLLAQYNLGNIKYTYTDFAPIAQVFESPLMHAAVADAPYGTLEECIAYAREHPGEIRWAHTGAGQSSFLACEALWSNYHGEDIHNLFKILAYTGGSDSSAAQLGGDVDIRTGSALDVMQYVDSGDIKLLAISGSERLGLAPDIPCYKDLGLEENFAIHQGFFARKEVPAEIIQTLRDIIFKAVDDPAYQEFCDKNGGFKRRKTGEEYAATLEKVDVVVKQICENAKT